MTHSGEAPSRAALPDDGRAAIVVAIRAARDASNRAIAARDVEQVVAWMLSDARVAVAHGPVLVGADASRRAFAEQFADRAFEGYVRETQHVAVHDPPTTATETGLWTGRWTRQPAMRGRYEAEWEHTPMGWRISSEHFMPGDP